MRLVRKWTVVWGALLAGSVGANETLATHGPVKAAVFRSTGTIFLGQTIWPELNAGWSNFGDVPVEIDYWSLGGSNITESQIRATDADVLIISAAGFLTYKESEIDAIINYVEEGHGIIITYFSFDQNKRRLAPLVGLSESITLGTGTADDPLQFDFLAPDHPLFAEIDEPYVSGVPVLANPYPNSWLFDGGTVLANLFTVVIPREPGIIVKETEEYRGLYFAHYPENRVGGTNQQDMQLFYNGLLWAAAPEPSTAIFVLSAGLLVTGSASRRRKMSKPHRSG
jgi:hypothetical protein